MVMLINDFVLSQTIIFAESQNPWLNTKCKRPRSVKVNCDWMPIDTESTVR